MIVCRIEMWPQGDESRKYELGEIRVTNIGGTAQSGDYRMELMKSASHGAKRLDVWRRGVVKAFPRLRLGQYDLLLRGLIACIGGRSPEAVHVPAGQDLGLPEGEMPIGAREIAP